MPGTVTAADWVFVFSSFHCRFFKIKCDSDYDHDHMPSMSPVDGQCSHSKVGVPDRRCKKMYLPNEKRKWNVRAFMMGAQSQ